MKFNGFSDYTQIWAYGSALERDPYMRYVCTLLFSAPSNAFNLFSSLNVRVQMSPNTKQRVLEIASFLQQQRVLIMYALYACSSLLVNVW